MKPAPDKEHTPEPNPRAKRLAGWMRFTAVIYRIILVVGLLLLAATAVLIWFTRRTYLWVVIMPLGLIALGILLAWVEYRLHMRLYNLNNQELSDGEE